VTGERAEEAGDGDDQWGHGVSKTGTERGAGACSRAERSWASGPCGKAPVLARRGLAAGPAHGESWNWAERENEGRRRAGPGRGERRGAAGWASAWVWVGFHFLSSILLPISFQLNSNYLNSNEI
jgi:hypothetical protein